MVKKVCVEINNRKEALGYMTQCFETYLGAAQEADMVTMAQIWNRMATINDAIKNEIREIRIVGVNGKPITSRDFRIPEGTDGEG